MIRSLLRFIQQQRVVLERDTTNSPACVYFLIRLAGRYLIKIVFKVNYTLQLLNNVNNQVGTKG